MELSDQEWRSERVEAEGRGLKVVFRNTRTGHLVRKYYRLPHETLQESIEEGRLLGQTPGTLYAMEELYR